MISYQFANSNQWIGHNKRLIISVNNTELYNIAADTNKKNIFLPSCLIKMFWKKVYFKDSSGTRINLWINRSSLAKRTSTLSSFVNYSLKRKNLNSILYKINHLKQLTEVISENEFLTWNPEKKASILIQTIEKKTSKYIKKAKSLGSFVKKKNGSYYIISSNGDFYIQLDKKLGHGGQKNVYAALDYHKITANLAFSLVKKKEKESNISFKKGLEICSKFKDSAHIINPILIVENNSSVFSITKRQEGDFSQIAYSKSIPFIQKIKIFTKILSGIADIHAQQYVHRDLKNENVLFKHKNGEYIVKIIDFDYSLPFTDIIGQKSNAGTLSHLAPEVFKGIEIDYPDKLDSWSLGIMLYELSEEPIPYGKNLKKTKIKTLEAIVKEGVKNLSFKKLDNAHPIRKVILSLLEINPETRMSVKDSLKAINEYLISL